MIKNIVEKLTQIDIILQPYSYNLPNQATGFNELVAIHSLRIIRKIIIFSLDYLRFVLKQAPDKVKSNLNV